MKSWSAIEFKEHTKLPEWMEDGIDPYVNPQYEANPIAGACEDVSDPALTIECGLTWAFQYRAGATIDKEIDNDSGIIPGSKYPSKLFSIPVLVIHGPNLAKRFPVKDIWTGYNADPEQVTVAEVPCGHFVVNEAPESVAQLTGRWLARHWEIS
jgi:pimeloyl-ACP methyl ester carboxylesterase